jgi:hypothetical protein
MVSILIIAVTFRIYNLIDGKEMVDLLKMSATAFFAANIVSKFTTKIGDKVKEHIREE